MIELRGNIWDIAPEGSLIVITTNGFVKRDGSCVMGKGIAFEAKNRYPNIEFTLGRLITHHNGNVVQFLNDRIIAFPVKPDSIRFDSSRDDVVRHMRDKFQHGTLIPGWACKADIEIIRQSCLELRGLLSTDRRQVYMPRPGCGAGELDWERDVKPVVEPLLHLNKFKVCTF